MERDKRDAATRGRANGFRVFVARIDETFRSNRRILSSRRATILPRAVGSFVRRGSDGKGIPALSGCLVENEIAGRRRRPRRRSCFTTASLIQLRIERCRRLLREASRHRLPVPLTFHRYARYHAHTRAYMYTYTRARFRRCFSSSTCLRYYRDTV